MTEVKHVSRKDLTAGEIVEIVNDGGRVVIELSVLGSTARVVIRRHDGEYYCDTPMMLMRHDTEDDLRDCLERYRLTKRENPSSASLAEPVA